MNKRGQLGLDTVKAVMITFLVLAVIAVTLLIILPEIRDVAETVDRTTKTIANTTTATVCGNTTGCYPTDSAGVSLEGLLNCELTITTASNQTDGTGEIIPASNYTVTACLVSGDAGNANCENTAWNITGSFTYSEARAAEITGNVTEGAKDFFNNTGTIFAILVVVVIILAIAIIIAVVSGFGGGRGTAGGAREGTSGYGKGTVMGI